MTENSQVRRDMRRRGSQRRRMRGDDAGRHPSAEEQACRSARSFASRADGRSYSTSAAAHPACRPGTSAGRRRRPGRRPPEPLAQSLVCPSGGLLSRRCSKRLAFQHAHRVAARPAATSSTLEPLRGGPNIQSILMIHAQTAPRSCKLRTPVSTTIAEQAPQNQTALTETARYPHPPGRLFRRS
jgi:hypothetical protein